MGSGVDSGGSETGQKIEGTDPGEPMTGRSFPGGHVLRADLRSLALLRVIMGVILLLDSLQRFWDREAFYSDFGVLSRQGLLELGWNGHWFSLHMSTGSPLLTSLLFLLQAALAVALVVGWHTRWVTFGSWLLLISCHARNPMVLNGGDVYLRCMLFWALFLPWEWAWSWDARRRPPGQTETPLFWLPRLSQDAKTVFGLAPLALLLQICFVYWFAALPKTDPAWTAEYSATQLVLQLETFLTPFGYHLREWAAPYLGTLTFLVIMWEFWGPFLLLFPFDRGQVRTAAAFGFSALHLGFLSALELGFFGWIGAGFALAALPSWFWDRPARRLTRQLDRFLARPERGPDPQPLSSQELVRDSVLLFLIVYVFLWNTTNENLAPKWVRLPKSAFWLGHSLRIDQRWNMFSPGPFTEDGWFVIEATRRDGSQLDLFRNGAEVSWEKPELISAMYPNERWRKFMMNLWLKENQKYRLPYGQYLCRFWNRDGRGEREVSQFKIYYMLERTNLDGTEQPVEKVLLWHHWCFEKPPEVPDP